jgi:tripeptide aminopeptidase
MPLGKIGSDTTANIGLLKAGIGRNIVPALVELEGEVRSHNEEKLDAQIEAMSRAMQEEADLIGATLDLKVNTEYHGFSLAPDSTPVLVAQRALERLGVPVTLVSTNGGSDANDLNRKGLPTAVLGTGMVAPHTLEEHIAVADLALLSRVVVELITTTSMATTLR